METAYKFIVVSFLIFNAMQFFIFKKALQDALLSLWSLSLINGMALDTIDSETDNDRT